MSSRPLEASLLAGVFTGLGLAGLIGGAILGLWTLLDSSLKLPLSPLILVIPLALLDLVVASGLRRMKTWAWYLAIINVMLGVPTFDIAISVYSFPLGAILVFLDLMLLLLVFRGREHFHPPRDTKDA